jgi:hypothetical protein
MREFRGQNFSLAYPEGWQAFGDNQSSMITLAPRDGVTQARGGQSHIGFGVTISYFFPKGGRNLRDGTQELINYLHANNPGMQTSGRARRVRVDGHDGLITMLSSSSPFGGGEVDALLTVVRPEGLFYMVFIAPENDFNRVQSLFDQMIRSVRFA